MSESSRWVAKCFLAVSGQRVQNRTWLMQISECKNTAGKRKPLNCVAYAYSLQKKAVKPSEPIFDLYARWHVLGIALMWVLCLCKCASMCVRVYMCVSGDVRVMHLVTRFCTLLHWGHSTGMNQGASNLIQVNFIWPCPQLPIFSSPPSTAYLTLLKWAKIERKRWICQAWREENCAFRSLVLWHN